MDSLNFNPVNVPHPGEMVVEYLDFHGWSQRDLARRTGLSPKTISEICNGKAVISAATALALEKAFNRPANFWMSLQSRFDEARLRDQESQRSVSWMSWARKFPITQMKQRGWLAAEQGKGSEVVMLLSFLGVASPESWDAVWSASRVAYRQTRKFQKSVEAISVWVRATELMAEKMQLVDFNEERLRDSLARLRHLTREAIPDALDSAVRICGEAGVALTVLPELPHTGISGCARWLNERRAILGITLRYRTDDQIWFTLFHELGHLLLHRRHQSFILDNAAEDLRDQVVDPSMERLEEEANRFASESLIPPGELSSFVARAEFTSESIHEFAESVGIGPGIVVGKLQHSGILKAHQGNALKQRAHWRLEPPEASTENQE